MPGLKFWQFQLTMSEQLFIYLFLFIIYAFYAILFTFYLFLFLSNLFTLHIPEPKIEAGKNSKSHRDQLFCLFRSHKRPISIVEYLYFIINN